MCLCLNKLCKTFWNTYRIRGRVDDDCTGTPTTIIMVFIIRKFTKPNKSKAMYCCNSPLYFSPHFITVQNLTTIMQKPPATKQVHIASTPTEANGIKLKKKDGTDQCLSPAKYSVSIYKMISPNQKYWLWQDCKKAGANGADIPVAKKCWGQPPIKQTQCLASAVESHKSQITTLTAHNQNMMATVVAADIDVPESNPTIREEEGEDHKIAANKKNSHLMKTNKKRKS